jgi:hypothetical protein
MLRHELNSHGASMAQKGLRHDMGCLDIGPWRMTRSMGPKSMAHHGAWRTSRSNHLSTRARSGPEISTMKKGR